MQDWNYFGKQRVPHEQELNSTNKTGMHRKKYLLYTGLQSWYLLMSGCHLDKSVYISAIAMWSCFEKLGQRNKEKSVLVWFYWKLSNDTVVGYCVFYTNNCTWLHHTCSFVFDREKNSFVATIHSRVWAIMRVVRADGETTCMPVTCPLPVNYSRRKFVQFCKK